MLNKLTSICATIDDFSKSDPGSIILHLIMQHAELSSFPSSMTFNYVHMVVRSK